MSESSKPTRTGNPPPSVLRAGPLLGVSCMGVQFKLRLFHGARKERGISCEEVRSCVGQGLPFGGPGRVVGVGSATVAFGTTRNFAVNGQIVLLQSCLNLGNFLRPPNAFKTSVCEASK